MKVITIITTIILSGCSIAPTFGEKGLSDFNKDFGRDNPLSPLYKIEPVSENSFHITLHQGGMLVSDANTRFELLKRAAEITSVSICAKIGMKSIIGNFVKLGDSGWVHLQAKFSCSNSSANETLPAKESTI